MYCIMTKKEYGKKDGTKTVWIEISTATKEIGKDQYERIIDAAPFFRRLGGTEYLERGYTPKGYLVTRLISTCPDKSFRSIRTFNFEV